MVKIYDTLPHHGDRFARMWEAYHRPRHTRIYGVSITMIAAIAALFVFAVVT